MLDERLSTHTQRLYDHRALDDRVRWLTLKASLGTNSDVAVLSYFEQRYGRRPVIAKAAVPPVTTVDGGGALLPPATDPIIALVQQSTLPTRLGLRPVPFNVPVPTQSALGTYAWVIQNTPKPVSRIDWTSVTNPPGKISGIVPLSRELVKLSNAEAVTTTALVGGAVQFADRQLLDPAVAGVLPNGSPASITNGVTPIVPTGTTLADKVHELVAALFAGRPQTQRAALIATPAVVAQLPRADGTLSNVQIVASPAAGSLAVALDADGVIYSDEGGSVDTSEEATVELNDAPLAPTGATIMTSFWQTNLVGFRVERMLWWQKVEPNVVQVLTVTP